MIFEQEDTIEKLKAELARLKSEHYQMSIESTENASKLQEEIENAINYEYVKNILISYFVTADTAVQANLLRVVFVALRFTREEQEKVSDAFNANN